jgi:flagellin
MTSINTNTLATLASNSLSRNDRAMATSMERLSTGIRINSAKDDAAGLAISSRMTSQIRGLDQAKRNAMDAISLIQNAEGALVEVSNMLQRMRELSVQSATDTNTSTDREALNKEFGLLRSEINRVAQNTQWNSRNLLDGSSGSGLTGNGVYKFQVGANAAQTINLTIGNYQAGSSTQGGTVAINTTTAASGPGATGAAQVSTLTIAGTITVGDVFTATVGDKSFVHTVTSLGADNNASRDAVATALRTGLGTVTGINATVQGSAGTPTLTFTASSTAYGSNAFSISAGTSGLLSGIGASNISSQAAADSAIGALDTAVATVNAGRSEMGATMNRLAYAADNMANISTNAAAARARVLDADYAKETTELARTQIISQAGTAMLAQANQSKQSVLALLK